MRSIVVIAALGVAAAACGPSHRNPTTSPSMAPPPTPRSPLLLAATDLAGYSGDDVTAVTNVTEAATDPATEDVEFHVLAGLFPFDDGVTRALPGNDGHSILYLAQVPSDPADPTAIPTPSVRTYDRRTHRSKVLVDAATSFALAEDGRLAVAEMVAPEEGSRDGIAALPTPTRVVVRQGLDGADETWSSTPGDFRVLGWAGKRLLVSRGGELLVADGPGRARALPGVNLKAISPRGDRILVTDSMSSEDELRMISLDDLTATTLPLPETVAFVGAVTWAGSRIVASVSSTEGLTRILHIDPESSQATVLPLETLYGTSTSWLRPRSAVGVLAATATYQLALFDCRGATNCVQRTTRLSALAPEVVIRVANPSRPSSLPLVQQ